MPAEAAGDDGPQRIELAGSRLFVAIVEHRVHRIGSEQHSRILVVDLVAPVKEEQEQFKRLGQKLGRLEEITRDKIALRQAGELAAVEYLEREELALINSTLLP